MRRLIKIQFVHVQKLLSVSFSLSELFFILSAFSLYYNAKQSCQNGSKFGNLCCGCGFLPEAPDFVSKNDFTVTNLTLQKRELLLSHLFFASASLAPGLSGNTWCNAAASGRSFVERTFIKREERNLETTQHLFVSKKQPLPFTVS